MHAAVAELHAELTRREPLDAREQASIGRFLTELERLPDPFDEHADAVHVTGSAIIVGPRGVVLLKHKRLGIWLQPGGHIDPGETPAEAALREAREETGLDVAFPGGVAELVHVDVHPAPRGHTHLDLRYLIAGDGDPAPPPDESQDVEWFGWDAAIERAGADSLADALASVRPDQ